MEQDLFPLRETPKHVPPVNGRRVSQTTCWRWAIKGVQGTKLQAIRIGRIWYTKREWLEQFGAELARKSIEELNPPTAPSSKPRTRTAARRERDIEAARDS